MRSCGYLRRALQLIGLAAILAVPLLRPEVCRAQTSRRTSLPTQSQPGGSDKSSQKDDQPTEGAHDSIKDSGYQH